jgi:hypothetical protein
MDQYLPSCLCTDARLQSESFRAWAEKVRPAWDTERSGKPLPAHRKIWEWCYIAQVLWEHGMLRPGRRGLGFGVGHEPLAALFASYGCNIVATDLQKERARRIGWVDTQQHADGLAILNQYRICDPTSFQQLVRFRYVDMNVIPSDLRGFDFTWSSCSFEHLGSIKKGLQFLENQMACLEPEGIAVHTTEFNLSSNQETIDHESVVLFRRLDIEKVAARLRTRGHSIDLDFDAGSSPADQYVDVPPFVHLPHLKLRLGSFVTTSIGLTISKSCCHSNSRFANFLRKVFPPRRAAA